MEAGSLELKQFVLSELAKLNLGFKVIDMTIELTSIVFVVAIEDSMIEFLVNEADQFQVRSVVHENQRHTDPGMLNGFNEFVASIIPMIKPVVLEKINDYVPPAIPVQKPTPQPQVQVPVQPIIQEVPPPAIPVQQPSLQPQVQIQVPVQPVVQEVPQPPPLLTPEIEPLIQIPMPFSQPGMTIEAREMQVQQKEEQLKRRALAIQARARLLEFQMQAVDVESHFFEELKEEQVETKDIKAWFKRGRFIFEWIIMLIIALLIVAFLIQNTR